MDSLGVHSVAILTICSFFLKITFDLTNGQSGGPQCSNINNLSTITLKKGRCIKLQIQLTLELNMKLHLSYVQHLLGLHWYVIVVHLKHLFDAATLFSEQEEVSS